MRVHRIAHFNASTFLAAPRRSKRLAFVTERAGRVRVLKGKRKGGTFLDIRGLVGCCAVETGLLRS